MDKQKDDKSFLNEIIFQTILSNENYCKETISLYNVSEEGKEFPLEASNLYCDIAICENKDCILLTWNTYISYMFQCLSWAIMKENYEYATLIKKTIEIEKWLCIQHSGNIQINDEILSDLNYCEDKMKVYFKI